MNWTASPCPDFCRYCGAYLVAVGGPYAIYLHTLAVQAAVDRGERLSAQVRARRWIERAERVLGQPLPKVVPQNSEKQVV